MQFILVDRPTVGIHHSGYSHMCNLFQNTFKSQQNELHQFITTQINIKNFSPYKVFHIYFGSLCDSKCIIEFYQFRFFLLKINAIPVGKIAKRNRNRKETFFINSALKLQCHVVKYTPTDSFLGDFAHWDSTLLQALNYIIFCYVCNTYL